MSNLARSSFDDTIRMAARSRATKGLRPWLSRLTEAHILFPALSILVLGVIWSTTINLIRVERTSAETAAAAAALELVNTYDAQVVRALRARGVAAVDAGPALGATEIAWARDGRFSHAVTSKAGEIEAIAADSTETIPLGRDPAAAALTFVGRCLGVKESG